MRLVGSPLQVGEFEFKCIRHVEICGRARGARGDDVADVRAVLLFEIDLEGGDGGLVLVHIFCWSWVGLGVFLSFPSSLRVVSRPLFHSLHSSPTIQVHPRTTKPPPKRTKTQDTKHGKNKTYPTRPKPPNNLPRPLPRPSPSLEPNLPRHHHIPSLPSLLPQNLAPLNHRHEFLRKPDFTLQAGPELGLCEDGGGRGGVDGGGVGEVESHHVFLFFLVWGLGLGLWGRDVGVYWWMLGWWGKNNTCGYDIFSR